MLVAFAAPVARIRHAHQAVAGALQGQGTDTDGNGASLAPLVLQLTQLLQQANAPKRVVRDAQGRVTGIEPVAPTAQTPMMGQ